MSRRTVVIVDATLPARSRAVTASEYFPSGARAPWVYYETVGGGMIALGLLTPIAAFIASGEMAVAFFKFHFPSGFWPIMNHGELPALYSFIFLYISAHGAGSVSIDAALLKARK